MLIPKTFGYVTLRGKRDTVGVIKNLEMGDYHGLSRWTQCNYNGP